MFRIIKSITILVILLFNNCCVENNTDKLYDNFVNPPAEARPFVRWWWNGNCVEENEIKRELDVMKTAGIGGVEINSIAMPSHAKNTGAKSLQWAGMEWIKMLETAVFKAKDLGMMTDLIVGSGWPFGGRFLEEDETMQRLGIKRQEVKANSVLDIDIDDYLSFKSNYILESGQEKEKSDVELISVKLIPVGIKMLDEIVDLMPLVSNNKLVYDVIDRDYVLVFVYNERNFESVVYGSPGADGPVMDHYKAEAVMKYLNRLKVIENETGLPLSDLIRALFCDSIELSGSNWTDDMREQFIDRNGYDIFPWLPLIIQPPGNLNKYETSEDLADKIKRVQYDYYNTIIGVFLERFTTTFQNFCSENGLLCRYQAYGIPFYMGLFQGNMIPDIPESNNWIYSRGRNEAETSEYTWIQNHGYMLWNKAASSAAHIRGGKIVSCEAMTNTQGVFRASLETFKQSDDMNFITGINHSVLHGYNYSPPEAGFPGWVRFGAYFSEQNTWWKYFKNWTDYNARLSAVFQNSKPLAEIAILGRLRDYWGEVGAIRSVFNDKPWYYAKLWQPISNLGSSCDYVHQPVIESAKIEEDELVCGEMRYKTVLLTNVESISPGVAQKLQDFASAGGKVVFIGETPYRSLSFKDADNNDKIVKEMIENVIESGNGFEVEAPYESEDLINWTKKLLEDIELEPLIGLSKAVSYLYTLTKTSGSQEIFFFVNSDRKKALEFDASFNTADKIPYLWIAETGERFALPCKQKDKLHIRLEALESALIVYDKRKIDLPVYEFRALPTSVTALSNVWDVKFEHVNGTVFTREMDRLIDFRDTDDEEINTFAGTVSYSTTFENSGKVRYIELDNVNEAVTELLVNNKIAGMKWYGNHCYDVSDFLVRGKNKIEIRLTNTLANYCMSLKDNPAAQRWAGNYDSPFPGGLEKVLLLE